MSSLGWFAGKGRRCPAAWKLTRFAASASSDPEIEQHLAWCDKCAARSQALGEIGVEARRLPAPPAMSGESRAQISARLLGATAQRPSRASAPPRTSSITKAAGASAMAAAFAVAIAGLIRDRHRPLVPASPPAMSSPVPALPAPLSAASHVSIRAIGDARFARVQPPPDEIVRLDNGRIELDVVPLARGERFRVVADNGEVEVRGTRFEVLAADRRLKAVSVSRGRVEVRSGGSLAVLDAGDRWEKGEEVPPARVVPSPRTRPAHRPSAAESALFDSGWASLRAGNARDAEEKFSELERRAQGGAIQEDALYWRAVATARCKETATAGRLFREFLAKFPRSARSGEAAVALGWLLVDNGEIDEARRAFERAASDPVATVRASALEGLRRTTPP